MENFADWLQSTSIAMSIGENWFPQVESLHVIALSVVAGTIFIVDFRLLGLASLAVPNEVPLQLTPARFVSTFVGLLVAAVLGSLISLRRVLKVDPASAIGTAS